MALKNEKIQYILSTLPSQPGVYLMKNARGDTIYVGKAVDLKSRVNSYFTASAGHSAKTKRMVAAIDNIEYIVLENDRQAFLTESDLIKSLRPYYNVLLKDDKSYPYIKVTISDEYPGIYVVRNKNDSSAQYFGPYPKNVSKKHTIALLQSVFPLRSCNKMPKRACLLYDLHLCLAPCIGACDKQTYQETVDAAIRFLTGSEKQVIEDFKQKMQDASDAMDFEKAAVYRDKINILTTISDNYILHTDHDSMDVIAYSQKGSIISFFIMHIRKGKIADKRTINLRYESIEQIDIGSEFIRQFYETNIPQTIVMHNPISDKEGLESWLSEVAGKKCSITVPQRGKLKALADTAAENSAVTLELYLGQIRNAADVSPIYSLAKLLGLEVVPDVIEGFDVSHLSGQDAVAAKVVYKEGAPYKSGYRRYSISDENAGSDTGSIFEVMQRRMKQDELPDLFLIDGGANQVSAAIKAVGDLVPVVGMVKDDKHKTRALVYNGKEYNLQKDMNLFVFISGIQNEAHRFAITYNRKKRTKRLVESELDNIPGVGENSKMLLLRHFGSVKAIKAAGKQQIEDVKGIGPKKAEAIHNYFRKS